MFIVVYQGKNTKPKKWRPKGEKYKVGEAEARERWRELVRGSTTLAHRDERVKLSCFIDGLEFEPSGPWAHLALAS